MEHVRKFVRLKLNRNDREITKCVRRFEENQKMKCSRAVRCMNFKFPKVVAFYKSPAGSETKK